MALYAKYNMLADVYEQTVTVSPSGQRQREWDLDTPLLTIDCIARTLGSEGLRTVGSTERFSEAHEDIEWVRLKTTQALDKRHRVGNIRTVNRWNETQQHWLDFDGNTIVFDVMGVAATQDPWGRLIEYEVLAKKVEV